MAEIINGVWHDVSLRAEVSRRPVANAAPTVDCLLSSLTEIMVMTQSLPETDRQRMRNFFLACGDLMMSRDRLRPDDRIIFEAALRSAASRRGGNDAS